MMMGRDTGKPGVAGGPAPHIPVLARRAIDALAPKDGGIYIDGTFGAGGHSRAILAAGDTRVIGLDRDQRALALGADMVEHAGGRLTLVETDFSEKASGNASDRQQFELRPAAYKSFSQRRTEVP